jgi:hypothetical protein
MSMAAPESSSPPMSSSGAKIGQRRRISAASTTSCSRPCSRALATDPRKSTLDASPM